MKSTDRLVLADLQAYRAARNATKQFQSIANTISSSVLVDLNGAPMPAPMPAPTPAPIADFMKAFQGPSGHQVKYAWAVRLLL